MTGLGRGCRGLTRLQSEEGWWLLVTGAFVVGAHRSPATRAYAQVAGKVTVSGLLRVSEPGGGFLRRNEPALGRWTSRDVPAIAAARGLPAERVAPYFVDAAESVPGGPVGGLTVVRFHNSHLVYALTWFALAGIVLYGGVQLARRERRLHRGLA